MPRPPWAWKSRPSKCVCSLGRSSGIRLPIVGLGLTRIRQMRHSRVIIVQATIHFFQHGDLGLKFWQQFRTISTEFPPRSRCDLVRERLPIDPVIHPAMVAYPQFNLIRAIKANPLHTTTTAATLWQSTTSGAWLRLTDGQRHGTSDMTAGTLNFFCNFAGFDSWQCVQTGSSVLRIKTSQSCSQVVQ